MPMSYDLRFTGPNGPVSMSVEPTRVRPEETADGGDAVAFDKPDGSTFLAQIAVLESQPVRGRSRTRLKNIGVISLRPLYLSDIRLTT